MAFRRFSLCPLWVGPLHPSKIMSRLSPFLTKIGCKRSKIQGAVEGVYLKGLNAQSKLFYMRKANLSTEKWIAQCSGHSPPLGLGKSVQSQPGLSSRKSLLQVQMPQGRSLASAGGSGQAIDLCFERSPSKLKFFRASPETLRSIGRISGEPVACTPDSCRFRHFLGFRDFH